MTMVDPREHKAEMEEEARKRGARLTPGHYLIGVCATDEGVSAQKRTPYVQGRLVCLEDLTRGRKPEDNQVGHDTLNKWYLTPRASGFIADVAVAVGWMEPFDDEDAEQVIQVLTHKPFCIGVRQQRDSDKYTEVYYVSAWDGRLADGSTVETTPEGKVADPKIRKRWGALIAEGAERHEAWLEKREERSSGGRGSSGVNSAWNPPAGGGDDYDDDLPF